MFKLESLREDQNRELVDSDLTRQLVRHARRMGTHLKN